MAQGPGEKLAPRERTDYSEVVRTEGKLFPALSVKQRHRSFSTAAGPPSHYPPPSSAAAAAAAASTSSSAETPPPTPHTLPSCNGIPLPAHVTSGRR
ncbi:hypothetical protein H920_17511 [Fukomys damarensis]|uniref:Uncharacterized protein n=1 Tax=Fukomys damarensis TaxID=885580 RepID=A0A091CTA1_FUKDA|nr:hypothetical protein H920_17511 [Fukomys damarensis]